ncbi:Retrovirus-related Pol polyprotein from transposon 17.6-like protein [Drosera capensis]
MRRYPKKYRRCSVSLRILCQRNFRRNFHQEGKWMIRSSWSQERDRLQKLHIGWHLRVRGTPETVERVAGCWLHPAIQSAIRSSRIIPEEERWLAVAVYRLSGVKQDLFDQLGGAKYLTKLDLRSGYYQVRIAEGDVAKTTCYEFLVMPFGLTNAPATFCTLINNIFHPFLDKLVVVYLDDIVIYSAMLEEHAQHLRKVFEVLEKSELYIKREKCSFAQQEVYFLGHKIKDGELLMDEGKVRAIQELEPKTKVLELRSFLGLVNYYWRFIKGYSAIVAPLTDLLKKNHAWVWTEACQSAFEELKRAVMSEPVLNLVDYT